MRAAVVFGIVLGVVFGAGNLVMTRLDPLADDSIPALLIFYGPMFALWGAAGFRAARRTGRILDGLTIAAVVAFVTFTVYDVANLIRVNVFFDSILARNDWRSMVQRFPGSGFENLRTYINYEYLTDAPFKILVATMIGAAVGTFGGVFGRLVVGPFDSPKAQAPGSLRAG